MTVLSLVAFCLGLVCGGLYFWHLYLESRARILYPQQRFLWQGFLWRGALILLPALGLSRAAEALLLLCLLLGFYLACQWLLRWLGLNIHRQSFLR